MKRAALILALLLSLSATAFADCGNEPPAGTQAPDLITPVGYWLHKALWEGTVILPGGWIIQFGRTPGIGRVVNL